MEMEESTTELDVVTELAAKAVMTLDATYVSLSESYQIMTCVI